MASRDPTEIREKTVGKSRHVRPIKKKRYARARESESEMEERASEDARGFYISNVSEE